MTEQVETKEEYKDEEMKYLRFGHVDRNRNVDRFISHITKAIPGDGVLPLRWGWRSRERFLDKHGHLGNILWAKATSSHLLMVDGTHIFRVWTDSAKSAVVDVCEPLAAKLEAEGWVVEPIPDTVMRKCKPFQHRTRFKTDDDVSAFIDIIQGAMG